MDPDTSEAYRINLDTGESEWSHPDDHKQGPLDKIEHRETVFEVGSSEQFPPRHPPSPTTICEPIFVELLSATYHDR